MPTVEERLERIERILEDSGLAFLADVKMGPTLLENLSLLMEPKNLRLLSVLDRIVEQADALEHAAESLEKLDRSGLLQLAGGASETLMQNLSLLMEPKNLRLVSHLANLVEVLAEVDPNALGMFVEAAGEAARETFTDEVLRQPPRVSAAGLLRQLSDPEVQQALGLLFLLLRLLPRTLAHLQREREQLESLMEQMKK